MLPYGFVPLFYNPSTAIGGPHTSAARQLPAPLHSFFYNPSTARGGPPPLTQGRHWRVPLNRVCADFDRLPCVRGAGSVS